MQDMLRIYDPYPKSEFHARNKHRTAVTMKKGFLKIKTSM
jgi:hypothetical protein